MFTFFKQAVHSVCSWFLEGEVQDTKAVARQFEQRKSDLEANIRQKQNEYAKSLQALSDRRESQLQAHVAALNEQLEEASAYTQNLDAFHSAVIGCVGMWQERSRLRQQLDLCSEQLTSLYGRRNSLECGKLELQRVSQVGATVAWQEMTQARELPVQNPLIEQINRKIEQTPDPKADVIRREIRRMNSEIQRITAQVEALKAQKNELQNALNLVQDQHVQRKALLQEQFLECKDQFKGILAHVARTHFVYLETEGIAPQHIYGFKEKVTQDDLRVWRDHITSDQAVNKRLRAELREAKQDANDMMEQAKRDDDYDRKNAAWRRQRDISDQQKAAYAVSNSLSNAYDFVVRAQQDIQAFVNHLKKLDVDTQLEAVCSMLAQNPAFKSFHAIGISPRSERQAHYARKQGLAAEMKTHA